MQIKKSLLVWIPVFIVLAILVGAEAYSYKRLTCTKDTYVYWADKDIPVSYWISNQFSNKEVQEIARAFHTWASVDDSKLRFIEEQSGQVANIRIVKIDSRNSAGTTPPECSEVDGHVTSQVTIQFSENWHFCWFQGRLPPLFCRLSGLIRTNVHTYSIALHEIGHAIGLDHPFGKVFPGEGRVSVVEPVDENEVLVGLFPDDVQAVQDIYPRAKESPKGAGISVALVLDRTGSMAGGKIRLAKSAATQFVSLMRTGDEIGVVSVVFHTN